LPRPPLWPQRRCCAACWPDGRGWALPSPAHEQQHLPWLLSSQRRWKPTQGTRWPYLRLCHWTKIAIVYSL
jgi:hypothetical protein